MIKLASTKECTGCMACSNICDIAIKIVIDKEGFRRPVIVTENCLNCGNCEKVCPVINPIVPERLTEPRVFACASSSKSTRLESSSGGVFTELAQFILKKHGIVFGAAFTSELKVEHIEVESEADLYKLRKSKYVQSDIGQCLKKAKDYLEAGQYVLFSGLPCQIAGLYSYLGNDYDKLYTVDILCKGAPSPDVLAKFISETEKRYDCKIQDISFRDKKYGWGNRAMMVLNFTNSKQFVLPLTSSPFGSGFSTDLFLRPSCYNCKYKNKDRVSDITLGDFWGIGEDLSFNHLRKEGVSLVMLNSEKGKGIFNSIKANLLVDERSLNEAVGNNSALRGQNSKNSLRALFFLVYKYNPKIALHLFTCPHRIAVWLRDLICRRRK